MELSGIGVLLYMDTNGSIREKLFIWMFILICGASRSSYLCAETAIPATIMPLYDNLEDLSKKVMSEITDDPITGNQRIPLNEVDSIELKNTFKKDLDSNDQRKQIWAKDYLNEVLRVGGRPNPGSLLLDSVVVRFNAKLSNLSAGSQRIGSYHYELSPGGLASKVKSISPSLSPPGFKPLKLVYFKQSNRYMIASGGLIVSFKSAINEAGFADEYGLNLKYIFSNAAAFEPVPFVGIESLMVALRNDARVSGVELDLIDPYLKEQ